MSRRHRIPQQYTILVSCTGKDPLVLSFRPAIAVIAAVVVFSLPIAWVLRIFQSYAIANTQLAQRNGELTQEAGKILQRLEDLESEINDLQERAGMPGESQPSSEQEEQADAATVRSQGGISHSVDAMTLLSAASTQMSGLLANLKGEVQPALEKTLERESAKPKGVPLKGSFDTSSDFGLRRSPFGGGYEFHDGLDFTSAYGVPIYATAPGVITIAGWNGGYGNLIEINHGYGYRTRYAHLSKLAVTLGTKVERNHIIGYLGNTGRSSGPHLHYEVRRDAIAVDPQFYLD